MLGTKDKILHILLSRVIVIVARQKLFQMEERERGVMTMGIIIGGIVVLAGIVTYIRTVVEIRNDKRDTRK